jgi:hypothetical protein
MTHAENQKAVVKFFSKKNGKFQAKQGACGWRGAGVVI